MKQINWVDGFGASVTICDKEGKIIYLNNKSALTFSKYGGFDLIGRNLTECHKPESMEKIKVILNNERANSYTIEKDGVKKLIYQSPWYENGELSGVVELSIEIPFQMDHFIRNK